MAVKTGRPPIDRAEGGASVPVNVRLPSRQYDEAYQRARVAGCSVPEILRRDLQRLSRQADPEDDE